MYRVCIESVREKVVCHGRAPTQQGGTVKSDALSIPQQLASACNPPEPNLDSHWALQSIPHVHVLVFMGSLLFRMTPQVTKSPLNVRLDLH